jgi:glycosyltransferase involved in cell wall biosynthesis
MKKLCVVATVELPIRFFMVPHLRALQQQYDITVILDTDCPDFLKEYGITAKVIPVSIRREISLLQDVKALFKLIMLFRNYRFDIVHSIAPKAGLLAMIAGFIARVPLRLHCFTGQVWATSCGFRRLLLKQFDRLIAFFATHLLTDSHSQRDFLLQEEIVAADKITVLASGSVSGVDLERFRPDDSVRALIRNQLCIPPDAILFLYLGRMKRDKGVCDLAQAARRILPDFKECYLVFAGPDEDGLKPELLSDLAPCIRQVRFEGYTKHPEELMAASDILCLPSYREGFGMVILEAAATGIPSIASRIYGITDAVVDGVTGLLHEPGNIEGIVECMKKFTADKHLRTLMGQNARQRASNEFSQAMLVTSLLSYYSRIS